MPLHGLVRLVQHQALLDGDARHPRVDRHHLQALRVGHPDKLKKWGTTLEHAKPSRIPSLSPPRRLLRFSQSQRPKMWSNQNWPWRVRIYLLWKGSQEKKYSKKRINSRKLRCSMGSLPLDQLWSERNHHYGVLLPIDCTEDLPKSPRIIFMYLYLICIWTDNKIN